MKVTINWRVSTMPDLFEVARVGRGEDGVLFRLGANHFGVMWECAEGHPINASEDSPVEFRLVTGKVIQNHERTVLVSERFTSPIDSFEARWNVGANIRDAMAAMANVMACVTMAFHWMLRTRDWLACWTATADAYQCRPAIGGDILKFTNYRAVQELASREWSAEVRRKVKQLKPSGPVVYCTSEED